MFMCEGGGGGGEGCIICLELPCIRLLKIMPNSVALPNVHLS